MENISYTVTFQGKEYNIIFVDFKRKIVHIANDGDVKNIGFKDISVTFKVNHFGNLISLICTDYCILAYVDCKTETVVINSNIDTWNDMAIDFKRLVEEAIHLEKPLEKIRTNMLVTTLDTYMKGLKKGFSVYMENDNLCLDYYNRPCSSMDRFSMYIDMDPNGYKECHNYLTKETYIFRAKYIELLNDIVNDE